MIIGLLIGTSSASGSKKTAAPATTTAISTVTVTAAAATVTAGSSPGPTVSVTVPGPTKTVQDKSIPTKTVQVRVTFTPAPKRTFTDGTYRVGSEIPAGTYHTAGGSACYWEKDRKGTGLTKIIENDNITGPTTIDIGSDVYAFKTVGGCTWAKR